MSTNLTEIHENSAHSHKYSSPLTSKLNTSLQSDPSFFSTDSDIDRDNVSANPNPANLHNQEAQQPNHADGTRSLLSELSSVEPDSMEDISNLDDPDSTCIINSKKPEDETDERATERKSTDGADRTRNWTLKMYEALNDTAISTTFLFSSFTGSAAIAYLTHQYRIGKFSGLLAVGVVSGVVALGAAEYFSVKGYIRKNTPKE